MCAIFGAYTIITLENVDAQFHKIGIVFSHIPLFLVLHRLEILSWVS